VSSPSLPADQPASRRKISSPDGAAAERQLARWIAEGDEAALAELFDLLGPTLYPVALGITEDPGRAETAIEETFAELWDKRAWLGRLPALSPWLLERCRSWAIALRTGTAALGPRALQDRAGDVPLARRLLRCPLSVRASRVTEALERLSPRERQVVALASRSGLSISEIAGQLGAGAQEVPALMRSALQSLRRGLERTLRREVP
jgi:RNA polymerase sigma-70 factor (ECF subfamily)